MYVEDVEDGKRTYRPIFIITFLIWYHLNVMLSMSKMSKINQIYLRAVMLCMSKMSKIDQMSKMLKMQGLSIPFAYVGSGDPVRVLHLYTMNTLDIFEAFIVEAYVQLATTGSNVLCSSLTL